VSRAKLKKFLEKIEGELQVNSSTYRKAVSDVKVHTFYLSLEGLTDHIAFQMSLDSVNISKRELNRICKVFFEELKTNFMGPLQGVEIYDKKQSSTSFRLTFRATGRYKGVVEGLDARRTFDYIKYIYRTPYQNFLSVVQVYYTKSKQQLNKDAFLDLGHANDSSVIKNRVSDLLQNGEIPKNLAKIPEVETLLKAVKDDKLGTVAVTFEAATLNRRKGSQEEAKFKRDIQADIRAAIEKLDIVNMGGSDTPIIRIRKKSIKRITDPFRKIKNVKVITEDTKLDPSSTAPIKLTRKKKAAHQKSRGAPAIGGIPGGRQTKVRQSSVNLGSLIGIINQQLPGVVAKNMRYPRLVNRTGALARSVRLVSITQTRQGFPSFGYTYDRSPYGVFESSSGSRQSSVERDPRSLIDASIREIAAHYTLGRLYTRREQ